MNEELGRQMFECSKGRSMVIAQAQIQRATIQAKYHQLTP